uniref:FLYWCH-type domain-containing protein n=1 Tax=Clastoptera arizonana TaxID=38151 RepID=A0A1B6DIZ5_9HEMI
MTMERIESNRKDCFLYVKDNYLYKLNKTVNGIRYLKCKKRFCKSTVKFKEGDVHAEVYPSEHNHEPNRTEVEILMLRSELRLTARSDIRPPRQIFEDVIRNYPLGAKSIGFPSVRTLIYKTRENSRPPIPICLEEYAEILNSENWCMYGLSKDSPPQLFFRKLLVDDQNNYEAIAVVFASFKVTSVMKSVVKTIHIDISTRTVPIFVGVTQLLTIHIVIKKYIFPAVYVLMKDKTKRNYQIIFEYLCNEICPEFIPENVVTDLDKPLKEILLYMWPTTKLVGFFFYYAQAIFQECRNFRMQMLLKNSIAARKVTRMLMALNLIPKSLLENALHYIKSYLKCNELSKQFVSLMGYVQNYWFHLSGLSSFSICTTTNCINDALKKFNSQMLAKMGPKPSVWIFTVICMIVPFEELLFKFRNILSPSNHCHSFDFKSILPEKYV